MCAWKQPGPNWKKSGSGGASASALVLCSCSSGAITQARPVADGGAQRRHVRRGDVRQVRRQHHDRAGAAFGGMPAAERQRWVHAAIRILQGMQPLAAHQRQQERDLS